MAAELTARVGRAAGHLEAAWSPERAAGLLRGVHERKKRQQQQRAFALVATVVALLVVTPTLVSSWRGHHGVASPPRLVSVAKVTAPGTELAPSAPLHLRDGSVARPQGPTSRVRLREDRPGRTVLALAGTAQFDIVHDPQRVFRVETQELAVEVLGTRFLVEEQGPQVRVTVQQGRVRVLWASHYEELGTGQSGVFEPERAGNLGAPATVGAVPPLNEPRPAAWTPAGPTNTAPPAALPLLSEPAPTALTPQGPTDVAASGAVPPLSEPLPAALTPKIPASTAAIAPAPRSRPRHSAAPPEQAAPPTVPSAPVVAAPETPPPPPIEPSSWQTLAHEGLFEQAYRLAYGESAPAHHPAEPPLLREREVAPGELLLLADVARLSHHPADAMAPLSRLLREHAEDPRAPLAAFTLGRVLLDDLGRPREAAQSFVRVQQLDPDGPLSQDALAREVEAWSRAGEAASARTRALQYVQKYPAGRRLRSVRHFGELL